MPISFAKKIIFIHVPKNAGTAIIESNDHGFENTNHDTALTHAAKYPNEWKTFIKVGVARNPWDRVVSNYEYAKMKKSHWHSDDSSTKWGMHPDYELVKDLTFAQTIEVLVTNTKALKHPGWIPQWEFLCDRQQEIMVDYVFKLEHLATDADFNVLFPHLKQINVSERKSKNYRDYYSPALEKIVSKFYEIDANVFDYQF